MRVTELEKIFGALNRCEGRYLVVGGVAVIAHGYERMTRDLDLVLALDNDLPEEIHSLLETLTDLGYRPMPAVSLYDLESSEIRAKWIHEKAITVLNLVSDAFERVPIDLFVASPFDFEKAWADAGWFEISESVKIPVVSKGQLIEMKRRAGRSSDLLDIEKLSETDRLLDE